MLRYKFRANQVVRDVLEASPDCSRKSLMKASNNLVQEQDQDMMFQRVQSLEKQGHHMSRCSDPEGTEVWAKRP